MKNVYVKPMLYAETFQLTEHMAAGCGYRTNFGNGCPIDEGGVTFFVNADSCSDDAVILWVGAGVDDESQRTIENLSLLNIKCYNGFLTTSSLFAS